MKNTVSRDNIGRIKLQKLVGASILIGFLSAFLAMALKRITEHYEHIFFEQTQHSTVLLLVFPLVGLTIIHFLRQYLFRNKENKGIREIFTCVASRRKKMPMYKIPSHFVNGLITVAFGGSTGIEVSTVVSSATIGSVAQQKGNFLNQCKTELICAGVAAGVAALFSSPIAGILFALEVIIKKPTRVFIFSTFVAVAVAGTLMWAANEMPLFPMQIEGWHYNAIPFFILLGILSGANAVYLTKCVAFFKSRFASITSVYRILLGASILSATLIIFPQLYGDGYHALREIMATAGKLTLTLTLALTFIGILILKPIATSVTLAAGGDGGVFAPGIFIGGYLGLLTALSLNAFFDVGVVPLNFVILGMAAMLSASIHAPFTAIFLVCGLTGNYALFLPLLLTCLVSKYTSKIIYPFTVYTMPLRTVQ